MDYDKTINIAFVGFWDSFDKENNIFTTTLRKYFDVCIIDEKTSYFKNSDRKVQYLFYNDFSNEYLDYNCIRIYYTGENLAPNFNFCDYGIGFDYLHFQDRYIRYPLYLCTDYQKDFNLMLVKQNFSDKEVLDRKFCSMVVSNYENSSPERKSFFDQLSKYKKVDSGGRYLNNIGQPNGVVDKQAFQEHYKFSIAFENSSHEGYCTEKIVQAFAAKTIPIYWGDTTVTQQFNKDSFINCNDFKNFEEVIEYIKKIDNDDNLYLKMLSTPAISLDEMQKQQSNFEQWLCNIINQDYEKAFRRTRYGRIIALEKQAKKNIEIINANNNYAEFLYKISNTFLYKIILKMKSILGKTKEYLKHF